jgi:hypothetical protein
MTTTIKKAAFLFDIAARFSRLLSGRMPSLMKDIAVLLTSAV